MPETGVVHPRNLRVAVVDDEPLVRRGLLGRLKLEPGMEVVAEAGDGLVAIERLLATRPDIVFLDVQMPQCDGFAVLDAILPSFTPAVVFVTAFDEYALRAFDVHAVDYLLKPFDDARFRMTIERLRGHVSHGERELRRLAADMRSALEEIRQRGRYAERFLVKQPRGTEVVPSADVDWIEAADNHVRLHVRNRSYLVRETIKSIEARLDPRQFIRVHRSTIVNAGRIQELQPWFNGELAILLSSGQRLTVGRRYHESFRLRFAGISNRSDTSQHEVGDPSLDPD